MDIVLNIVPPLVTYGIAFCMIVAFIALVVTMIVEHKSWTFMFIIGTCCCFAWFCVTSWNGESVKDDAAAQLYAGAQEVGQLDANQFESLVEAISMEGTELSPSNTAEYLGDAGDGQTAFAHITVVDGISSPIDTSLTLHVEIVREAQA